MVSAVSYQLENGSGRHRIRTLFLINLTRVGHSVIITVNITEPSACILAC